MGTYTTIEVKCTLRPDKSKYIELLHVSHDWKEMRQNLISSRSLVPWYVEDWVTVDRCNFIPFGALGYTTWAKDGFSNLDGRTWHFMCSIKNYGGEVEHFLQNILPQYIESLEICRTQNEQASEETRWVMVNGKIWTEAEQNEKSPRKGPQRPGERVLKLED